MLEKHRIIRITTFPRIHISLIGMSSIGYRINGGIGFSISTPELNLVFEENDFFEIEDYRDTGFSPHELYKLMAMVKGVADNYRFAVKYKCVINNSPVSSHIGLGSNTAIYLSCIEALFILNDFVYLPKDVIECSNRGGTSGIGINTYFYGGFVFDAGVPSFINNRFLPSSKVQPKHAIPLALRRDYLPNWELGICIPPIMPKTEEEEALFFRNNCPIDKQSVDEILYHAIYGIAASIAECDINVFCAAVNAIQNTKWKRLERSQYGDELFSIESLIRNAGAMCVGMSSLGPLLYFFGEDINAIIDNIVKERPDVICYKTTFNNEGRVIQYD